MTTTDPEKSKYPAGVQKEVAEGHHDHDAAFERKASINDFKADAILAENEEHNMTVMQAVKLYPMASFWAFIMSCTIVSINALWP